MVKTVRMVKVSNADTLIVYQEPSVSPGEQHL